MDSRQCYRCKAELPIEDFGFNARNPGGINHMCKPCCRAHSKKMRLKNPEVQNAWKRKWYLTEKGKAKAKRDYENSKQHPDRTFARWTSANAVRDGKLIRRPCEICGAPKTDGHHDDYSRPLDVRWLCRKHHARHHAQQGSAP